ncbi:MAG: 30S ribosomal protein S12 methylthiotransferase RimO [Acidobacteria bacterium]|nr:30S ribosomal protein S12 methylthiotransferase RimO [Acidobacteriota bacterium]
MAKIGFISLGCPKNLVDSEVMVGLLQKKGHTITADPAEAEILVVNTCSFIEASRMESIETILEAARLKNSGACRKLVVAGCLAERYPKQILENLKEVDALVGVNQIEDIVRVVSDEPVNLPDSYGRSDADLYLYDHTTPRALIGPRHSAYVKISEGCDHACAFCVIPKIRGRYRSRSIPSLVKEATRLASRGVKEIILISQDTTSYGLDFGMQDGLASLLEALAGIRPLRWIRVLYAYPSLFSDRLIGAMNSSEKICRYVDMPLQHASARVLKAMKRGGTRKSLSRLVGHIRKKIPGVAFRTAMIVGFPGETKADFLELKDFCREMEFDRLGVFTYSDEEDTIAGALYPKIPGRTAEYRRRVLMQQQKRISARKNRALIGQKLPVLVQGPARESDLLLEGRLQSQAPEIDGICLINDSEIDDVKSGRLYTVEITRAFDHDLLGRIVR